MLGLVDRSRVFDLFHLLMKGEAAPALALVGELYQSGADPALLIQDLLDLTHWLTRIKLAPEAADDPAASEIERRRGREMAVALALPVLTRSWQMLLKGLAETSGAPSPLQAAEMVLIRLMHAADMPPPGELARRFLETAETGGKALGATTVQPVASSPAPVAQAVGATSPPAPLPSAAPSARPMPESFAGVVALADAEGDLILRTNLARHVHLVHFELGRIEFRPGPQAPANLANKLGQRLGEWTGRRWIVSISGEAGEASLEQQAAAAADAVRAEAERHPLVQAALSLFPGSAIEAVRALEIAPMADPAEVPEQVEENS